MIEILYFCAILTLTGGNMKIVCNNPNASFLYFLLDKYEAGVVLSGDEIKAVRAGHMSIKESFVTVKDGEAFLKNAYIEQYSNAFDGVRKKTNERRDRKLLLHKTEISKLEKAVGQEGLTVVPIKAYFDDSYLKISIATAKGKKTYDKRESIKQKDLDRKLSREQY